MRVARLLAFYLLGLFLGGIATSSFAASVALQLPANVNYTGGSYVTKAAASFSGAAFNSGMTAQVAGKTVTVPATWRLAANAGQFASNAVRLNPALLVGSAVAVWLAQYGLQYAEGWYYASQGGVPMVHSSYCVNSVCRSTAAEACHVFMQNFNGACGTYTGSVISGGPTGMLCKGTSTVGGGCDNVGTFSISPQGPAACPAGYSWNGTLCMPQAVPATDQNWNAVPQNAPLPDSAATELAPKGVPLPLQRPEFSPDPIDIPLGDPWVDPSTGKRYRDQARVTPQPSSDPPMADVQVTKQEVDVNGQPVIDPATQAPKTPEEQEDLCKKNPDAALCKSLNPVADTDLQQDQKTIQITPVEGFGPSAGTCPADRTMLNKNGQAIVWEWDMFCDFAEGIRPLVIGFAWLGAILGFFGVARRNT